NLILVLVFTIGKEAEGSIAFNFHITTSPQVLKYPKNIPIPGRVVKLHLQKYAIEIIKTRVSGGACISFTNLGLSALKSLPNRQAFFVGETWALTIPPLTSQVPVFWRMCDANGPYRAHSVADLAIYGDLRHIGQSPATFSLVTSDTRAPKWPVLCSKATK
ncbi:MAG: hypothetical protein J5669_05635, partial [Bacteroidales bacterium]|nr:hypothetical protein [Bacteroidales bacterium]